MIRFLRVWLATLLMGAAERFREVRWGEVGKGMNSTIIVAMIGAFVLVVVGYNLIPSVVDQNAIIQADVDADPLTKLGANIGEWLFAIAVTVGGGFLVWKAVQKG